MGVVFVEVLFDICFCVNICCYCGVVFVVVGGVCYCNVGGLYVGSVGMGIVQWFYYLFVVSMVGGVMWVIVGVDVFFVVGILLKYLLIVG